LDSFSGANIGRMWFWSTLLHTQGRIQKFFVGGGLKFFYSKLKKFPKKGMGFDPQNPSLNTPLPTPIEKFMDTPLLLFKRPRSQKMSSWINFNLQWCSQGGAFGSENGNKLQFTRVFGENITKPLWRFEQDLRLYPEPPKFQPNFLEFPLFWKKTHFFKIK